MTTKNIAKHDTNTTTKHPQDAASFIHVAPAPTAQSPAIPPGFDPKQKIGRGRHTPATLVGLASAIATEVRHSPTFAEDFGGKQDAAAIAASLETAAAWRAEKTRTRDWFAYVRRGDAAAWQAVQLDLDKLRAAYEYAASFDPTIRARYPQLTELFRSQSAVGIRAGNTRRNKKAAAPPPPTPAKESVPA